MIEAIETTERVADADTVSAHAPSVPSEQEVEAKMLRAANEAAVITEWTPEADAILRSHRDGKKTIAIVGFSPTSRHLAPFDDDRVEIWSVNEAHRHHTNYLKRFDRWIQIHRRWDFTKNTSLATKEHWEWLQQPHDFPIYMQEHYDDVPASVAFPLDEVKEAYPGVLELMPTGEEEERDYFTSTFAYMCTLAMQEIDKQPLPGRIEVYGFDMATGTEYVYQKGSTEYWMGYARGHNIEVVVPYKCRLVNGKLYGYEISRVIPKSMLQELHTEVVAQRDVLAPELKAISEKRHAIEKIATAEPDFEKRMKIVSEEARPLFNREIDLSREANSLHGEIQEYQDLINYIDKGKVGEEEMFINRQLLEFRMNTIQKERQNSMNTAMIMRGRRTVIQQDLTSIQNGSTVEDGVRDEIEKKGADAFNDEFNSAAMVNALYGRNKVLVGLLRYLDNMQPEDNVLVAAMMNDPLRKIEGQ